LSRRFGTFRTSTFRIKKNQKPTLLGHILLGLLLKAPQTGYELRRLFTATPLMSFSDSPGAIYPALRRLKDLNLIEDHITRSGRGVCRLTKSGLACLRQWLLEPVTKQEIVRDVGLLLMRFSLMDDALGRKAALRLLSETEPQLASHIQDLRLFFDDNAPSMPLSGRLALDYGIRSYDTLLKWIRDAIDAYAKPK
jgi:DNA-binding PadR family transcriptional regulator